MDKILSTERADKEILFAIIAKSVPKKLVTWPKILVTQLFWHILSRLSSRPASEVPTSRPAGKLALRRRAGKIAGKVCAKKVGSRVFLARSRVFLAQILLLSRIISLYRPAPWTKFCPRFAPKMGTYVSREFSLTTEFTRTYVRTMYCENSDGGK